MKQLSAVVAGLVLFAAVARGEDQPPAFNAGPLTEMLQKWDADKEPTTQKAEETVDAIVKVGQAAIPPAIAALSAAAKDKPLTAGILITALSRLKAKDATAALAKLAVSAPAPSLRRNAMAAVASIGTADAMPILIQGLDLELPEDFAPKDKWAQRDDWYKLQGELTTTIQKMCGSYLHCNAAVQYILSRRGSVTPAVRARYAEALGNVQQPPAEDALISLAFDPDATVQAAAVRAIGLSPSPRIGKRVLPLIGHSNPKVKIAVCIALGKSKHVAAIPSLIKLLDSKEKDVPESALFALRAISGFRFVEKERWESWYADEVTRSKKEFKELVERAKTDPVEILPATIEQMADLVLARELMVDEVRVYLDHKDLRVRAAACNVVAQSGDPRAPAFLLSKLMDSTPQVSNAAWRGLRYITGEKLPLNHSMWSEFLAKRG